VVVAKLTEDTYFYNGINHTPQLDIRSFINVIKLHFDVEANRGIHLLKCLLECAKRIFVSCSPSIQCPIPGLSVKVSPFL
jgi:hypothetical protein